jgi:hypothetical protein
MNSKYLTPILTIVLLAVGFFQTSISDGEFTNLEKWQLAALFVGAVVTYIGKILPGPWPSALKIGGAVIGAALAAIITAVQTGSVFDTNMFTIIILAALNAFAAQIGVDARVTDSKALLADPLVTHEEAVAADSTAVTAALSRGATEVLEVQDSVPASPDEPYSAV